MRPCLALAACVLAAACARPAAPPAAPATTATATCLDLPGTYRWSLRLAPGGDALYWVERVSRYGYADGFATYRLVRWDLAGAPISIGEGLAPPFRILADGRILALSEGGLIVWDRGEQALVSPDGPTIDHVEVLGDQRSVVYLAAGWAMHQPLARTVGRRLSAAEDLLGVAGAVVYLRFGGRVFGLDTGTGVMTPAPVIDGEPIAVHGGAVIADRGDALTATPFAGGPAVVVAEGAQWRTVYTPDGVFARRAVDDRHELAVLSGAPRPPLPTVTGAFDVTNAAALADGRTALLVVHDTDRDGEVSFADESDVCFVPAGVAEVAIERRDVPRRHAAAASGIDAAVARHVPGGRWRLVGAGGLPRVVVVSPTRLPPADARRAVVTALAAEIVAAIGDDAYDVELVDVEGRRVLSEWQAWQRRRITFAGVGAALAAAPDEAGVVVTVTRRETLPDGKVACEGTMTARDATYRDLTIRCVEGAAPLWLDDDELAPGETAAFAGVIDAPAGAAPTFLVHHTDDHEVPVFFDAAQLALQQARVGVVEEVVDRTGLALVRWGVEGDLFVIDLAGPDGFSGFSHVARAAAAGTAHDLLAPVATSAFEAPAGLAVWLRIAEGGREWTSDGGPPHEITGQ